MGILKVSGNSIQNDAERIGLIIESLPTLMNELEEAMQQLADCWEGPAWGIYQENVAKHMELLSEIYKYLSKYASNMQQACTDYCRAEQNLCAEIGLVFKQ